MLIHPVCGFGFQVAMFASSMGSRQPFIPLSKFELKKEERKIKENKG